MNTWTVTYNVPTVTTKQGVTQVLPERAEVTVEAGECDVIDGGLVFGSSLGTSAERLVHGFAPGEWIEFALVPA